jgi:hypothetical protein
VEIPERFIDYQCADYFASDKFVRGVWDESSQLWVIVAADEIVERPELEFLVIGRPGCDGIEFGYRKGHDGLWAYYPIGREFTSVAPSISTLVEGWRAGSITV